MSTSAHSRPSQLTDNELLAAVKRHAQGTRASTVALIVHLTELESRRLHLAAGFGSLFEYCREELRLSEHAAYHVIKAIRPARRFPLVLDKLLDGSLNVLSHAIRGGDATKEVFRRALAALARELAREKFADPSRPRKSRGPAPGSREPAAKVKREVWGRDGGRCRFVGKDGRRCTERRFIQFHHSEKPYAAGGEAKVEAIQLR